MIPPIQLTWLPLTPVFKSFTPSVAAAVMTSLKSVGPASLIVFQAVSVQPYPSCVRSSEG